MGGYLSSAEWLIRDGITTTQLEDSSPLQEVNDFGETVQQVWLTGKPVTAFGLHFALEYSAANLHPALAQGLEQYPFLSLSDREYFEYHKEAERRHADFSERGLSLYAKSLSERPLLEQGVSRGLTLMTNLYDGYLHLIQ